MRCHKYSSQLIHQERAKMPSGDLLITPRPHHCGLDSFSAFRCKVYSFVYVPTLEGPEQLTSASEVGVTAAASLPYFGDRLCPSKPSRGGGNRPSPVCVVRRSFLLMFGGLKKINERAKEGSHYRNEIAYSFHE